MLEVLRLRSDSFRARSLVGGEGSALEALRALLAQLLARSGAVPLPDGGSRSRSPVPRVPRPRDVRARGPAARRLASAVSALQAFSPSARPPIENGPRPQRRRHGAPTQLEGQDPARLHRRADAARRSRRSGRSAARSRSRNTRAASPRCTIPCSTPPAEPRTDSRRSRRPRAARAGASTRPRSSTRAAWRASSTPISRASASWRATPSSPICACRRASTRRMRSTTARRCSAGT